MIKVINKDRINESVDEMENEVTPVTPAVGTPVDNMQDIPAEATDAAGKIAEEDDFKEYKVDYTDPKYQKIIDYLNNNGYPGSKFLGKMGFYIPQNTSYVSIIFDDIVAECSIMTTRYRLSPAGASDYMSELAQVIPVVDAINAILADATTVETKDRHVSESVEPDNDPSNGGD